MSDPLCSSSPSSLRQRKGEAAVEVVLLHNKQEKRVSLPSTFSNDEIAASLGLAPQTQITAVHKGRRLKDGDELSNNMRILVIGGPQQQQQKTSFFSPSSSSSPVSSHSSLPRALSWLPSFLHPALRFLLALLSSFLPSSFLRGSPSLSSGGGGAAAAAAVADLFVPNSRRSARKGTLVDISFEFYPGEGPDSSLGSGVGGATPSNPTGRVIWCVDGCGALTTDKVQTFEGSGPWRAHQVLLANGDGGVVTCVISDSSGDRETKTIWFAQHEGEGRE